MSSSTFRVFYFCMPTSICSIFDPNRDQDLVVQYVTCDV